MRLASSVGLPPTATVFALLLVLIGARLGLKTLRRNGRRVSGAEAGSQIERAIDQLLAGKVGFVVLSCGSRDYVQFARQPGEIIVAEANPPPGEAAVIELVVQAGMRPTGGLPAFHGEMRSPTADYLKRLATSFFQRGVPTAIHVRAG